MHAEEVILVTGATGNTASSLLQQLETRGARVRAMVRRQPDRGDCEAYRRRLSLPISMIRARSRRRSRA